ncbi:MAG TPA: trehalose-6-phosphate synthase [Terriglobales bacterium]|nr:trehalose-6-phosphate synthase [Terriglobales bacterium]
MNSILMVSNRLPVTVTRDEDGVRIVPSSGGLVSALTSALNQVPFTWIGWPGADAAPEITDALQRCSALPSCKLLPVDLGLEERNRFYRGFCNEILWPLFHDLQSRCNFDPSYWETYGSVNRRFADRVIEAAREHELIWVHDYHLLLLGSLLRNSGEIAGSVAYFHHIPFPPPDIFAKLPWRKEILESLLCFDLVGFQTRQDLRNFISSARRFLTDVHVRRVDSSTVVTSGPRTARLAVFPIGIDSYEFAACAARSKTAHRAKEIRTEIGTEQICLGVDRLDYTKGIPERLRAFAALLSRCPDLRRQITLVQVVVPSRSEVPKYSELKLEVERLVSKINGEFGVPGWVPIQYMYRHLDRTELIALYRSADIGLVTPLRDGMNLVAKEFCAAQTDDDAVLILSEFAGAAEQLKRGALLVNPYDTYGVAAALHRAIHMPTQARQRRMRALRQRIAESNVYTWFSDFIRAAGLENSPEAPRPRSSEAQNQQHQQIGV